MLLAQKFIPQNIVINAIVNKDDNVEIAFMLMDETQGKEKEDCVFPIISIQKTGIENIVSTRLIWEGDQRREFIDELADKNKTVYNILKSQCESKNRFQLYITVTDDDTDVEIFVAQGIAYVYK